MSILASIFLLTLSAVAGSADPRVAQLPADLTLVESVGPYRLAVFRVCSPEHCWHDSFVQELSQDESSTVICSAPINELNATSDVIVASATPAPSSTSELKLSLLSSHDAFLPYVATISFRHGCGYNLRPTTPMAANNAFKPKLHRCAVNMAEKACHVASCALQFGLT
jgi:hypothetical protein